MSSDLLLEHVSCDLCGCKEYKIRYRKPDTWLWLNQYEYPIVECIKCSLVYLNPRPTIDSMAQFYPSDYHDNRDDNISKQRYEEECKFLPNLVSESVLDIGCAKGDFLIHLKNKYPGIEISGVDYYSRSVNSNQILFYNQLLTECDFKSKEFDIITSWAVFEHLHKPGEYFEVVSKILKPGGKFIFLVTNSESLYGKKSNIEDIPRHTYHFSEKTIKQYAKKFGFSNCICFFNDSIYDGRGSNTIQYTLENVFGVTWEKRYFNELGFVQRKASNLGKVLDRIIFRSHWEAKQRKSGIMIVEFTK